ncbi:Rha family transcriptional regulator [Methylobacterium aquaticum]|uniref:Rha family transcriptional regulator n=1 Tax=Methylobacterium aquaticum TaxID=270351 RepID=UPI003D1855A1
MRSRPRARGSTAASPVEAASLTKKRHDHVMRDTRKMLVELHGPDDAPKFGAVYRDAKGEDRPCYRLPKREVMILVTGYSISLRAAVIDRLAELEAERAAALQAVAPARGSAGRRRPRGNHQ